MSMQLTSRRLVSGGDGRGVGGGEGVNGRSWEDSGRAGGRSGDPCSAVQVCVGYDGCVADVSENAWVAGGESGDLEKVGW